MYIIPCNIYNKTYSSEYIFTTLTVQGRTSHIHKAMFIMGFGSIMDMIHLITYSSK